MHIVALDWLLTSGLVWDAERSSPWPFVPLSSILTRTSSGTRYQRRWWVSFHVKLRASRLFASGPPWRGHLCLLMDTALPDGSITGRICLLCSSLFAKILRPVRSPASRLAHARSFHFRFISTHSNSFQAAQVSSILFKLASLTQTHILSLALFSRASVLHQRTWSRQMPPSLHFNLDI